MITSNSKMLWYLEEGGNLEAFSLGPLLDFIKGKLGMALIF